MSITLNDVLNKNLLDGLQPISGLEGLTHSFNWVNIMEILDVPDNIKPDELLITTGYDLSDEEKHKNLIARLNSRGVTGMIIQTGYYLDHIPEYLVKSSNACAFPILEVPAKYSFSEILHILIDELNKYKNLSSKAYLNLDYFYSTFLNKLYNDVSLLQSENAASFVFAFSPVNPIIDNFKLYKNSIDHLISFLVSVADDYVFNVAGNGEAVIYLSLQDEKSLSAVCYDLQVQLTFLSEQYDINVFVGVSTLTRYHELRSSLKQTIQCISLLDSIGAKRGVCSYDNYTFIKMFGYLYKNNQSFVLENQALQTLLSRDRNSNCNYVHTLRIYLSENCNTTHTAERLFIHRHTLINRIQTIQDITGIDLSNYYTRLYLSMALLIHDYYAV